MLLINYKYQVAMINLGDHLKVKQAYKKNLATFWQKKILSIFPWSYWFFLQKELDSYLLWFFYGREKREQTNRQTDRQTFSYLYK